jgi:hypothetical protein
VRSETYRVTNPCALLDDAIVFVEPALTVMPLDTLAPEVRVPEVRGQVCVVQPGGQRVAISQGLGFTPGVTVVDLADPRAPAVAAAVSFDDARIVGANGRRLFVCDAADHMTAVDWVDGASGAVDDAGICAFTQLASSGRSDLVIDGDPTHNDYGAVYSLDDDGVHMRGNIGVPRAVLVIQGQDHVDGNRAMELRVLDIDDRTIHVYFTDLQDPDHPDTQEWTPAPQIEDPSLLSFSTVRAPFVYSDQPSGLLRIDASDVHDVVVDAGWSIAAEPSANVALVDDRRVLLAQGDVAFGDLFVASTLAGAGQPLAALLGTGHIVDVVSGDGTNASGVTSGAFVAVSDVGLVPFADGNLTRPVALQPLSFDPNAFFDSVPFAVGDSGAFGLANHRRGLLASQGDAAGVEVAIGISATDVDIERPVLLAALDASSGTQTQPMALDLPDARDSVVAASIEGCFGVGVAYCAGDASCSLVATTLSACEAPGFISALAPIPLATMAPADVYASAHHGSRASLFSNTGAALVDLTSPSSPTAIEVALPPHGPFPFPYVTAAFDDDTWLIVQAGDIVTGSHALVFDTSGAGAPLLVREFDFGPVGSFEDGEGEFGDIPRRALLVDKHTAVVNDWDPNAPHDDGHSVVFYDLDADPPVVVASVPIAGRPLRAFRRPNGAIVVVRENGVSVIRPECAGP